MKRVPSRVVCALEGDPGVLERFWAQVARDDSADGCWEWQGRRSRHDGRPLFCVRDWAITPLRIAWFAATGEVPSVGRVHQRCENLRCVRPEHLTWTLGRRTAQTLQALSDGYVELSRGARFGAAG